MNANLETIAEELFGKIRTRFPKIQLGDEQGVVIANNKDIGNARFFEFDYSKEGVNLGSVSIELSEENGLTVMYSNDIAEGQPQPLINEWYGFLKSLREFAKRRLLNFDTRDLVKTNLDKRDYDFLAKNSGEGQMTESKLWGTNRTSFQNMGEAKIIVKHSQNVNYDNPAGRTLHIESIFIENAEGERFKYPFKHLNGARALAQHVAHGGTPYDMIGEHVIGLSEELSKLRFFKGYVSRQDQISEAMGSVTDKVIERIDQVKKEIHQLQSASHYASFVESFTQSEAQQIPEDTVNDWVDKLTIRNFNEALKDVFPYIYKLVGEGNSVKELNADDLLGEEKEEKCDDCHKPVDDCECDDHDHDDDGDKEIKEFAEYERTLESMISEDGDGIASTDEEVRSAAVEKLNDLLSQNLKVGQDGTNAKMSLKDIINDNEFERMLDDAPAETELNALIKGWVETNHEELMSELTFPDGEAEAPAPEPAPAEAPAAAAEPAPAEAPAAPAPEEQPAAPVAEGDDSDYEDMQHRKPTGAREIVEFVKSFYDRETGNFPKGETGVCIAAEKEFGEGAGNVAKKVIERIHGIAEELRMKKMTDTMDRSGLSRMSELAGVNVSGALDSLKSGAKTVRRAIDKATLPAGMHAEYDKIEAEKDARAARTPSDKPVDLPSFPGKSQSAQPTPESAELTAMLKIAGLR